MNPDSTVLLEVVLQHKYHVLQDTIGKNTVLVVLKIAHYVLLEVIALAEMLCLQYALQAVIALQVFMHLSGVQ